MLLAAHTDPSLCPCRLYDDNVTEYGRIFYFYIWEVPIFLAMGMFAGVLGALFNSLHIKFAAFRAKYIPPRLVYRRLAEVGAAALLGVTPSMKSRSALRSCIGHSFDMARYCLQLALQSLLAACS